MNEEAKRADAKVGAEIVGASWARSGVRRSVGWGVAIALACSAGCGGPSEADDAGSGGGADAVTADTGEAPLDADVAVDAAVAIDRGPTRLPIEGDPNGILWDADDATLYLADDNNNRILRWTDASGFGLVAELPAAPASGPGLGQLGRTDDGTFVVTRFGGGTAGDVVYVTPDGVGHIVPGLDAQRRRIGLSVAPDGTIYTGWFVRISTGDRVGAIGTLSLTGGEPEVLTGFVKPVGVVATEDTLYVTDQDRGQVLRVPRASLDTQEVIAELPGPDLLALGPDGSLFTGTTRGEVVRIGPTGAVTVLATGFAAVRGVAYDPAGRRLFAVDHDTDESDGVSHAVRILPID